MKTYLFNELRKFLFLPLLVLVAFTSCQNEESEVTEPNTEETFNAASAVANLMLRTATFDGSYDNIIDYTNCIAVNLPVTVTVNGITVTIQSLEDYEIIEEILDEFSNDDDEVEIQFPITIIFSDYTETVINNYDELYAFIEDCLGENEEDDDIECIDFQYPIFISLYNAEFQVIDTDEINDDEELYEFIDGLEGGLLASINFPVTMVLADGSTIEVNNNDELQAAIEEAEDACDEDDDNDWNDDDQDCSEDEIGMTIVECLWEISEYNDSDDFDDYQINFDENYWFYVSLNGNILHDGSWSITEVEGECVLNFDTDWGDLEGDWTFEECEGDEFYLSNGEISMELEQDCDDSEVDCSAQEISSHLVECVWYGETSLYDTYATEIFIFNVNGTFSTQSSGGETVGSWNIAIEGESVYLVINSDYEPYNLLSMEWLIIECDDDRIKAVNGDEYVVFEQDCQWNSGPLSCLETNDIELCDENNDGYEVFNIYEGLSEIDDCTQNNTVSVTFHTSLSDAESNLNPIPDATSFANTSNPQTIYIRIEVFNNPSQFEVLELDLILDDCSTSDCTEEQVDEYLMECHWVAVSYNGDDQLLGYNIYFNENMDLVVEGNGGTSYGTWSTAGNPANGVFLTIEQLPADLQDLIGQWQVVECTEEQIILHDDNNVEVVLERDCNYSGCNEDQVNNYLLECTWNVINYNNSNDLIIFGFDFNNDGTVLIEGDGQTITAMWSTSSNADGIWIEFSEINAGNIQIITGNWLVVECGEEILQLERENDMMFLERTCL